MKTQKEDVKKVFRFIEDSVGLGEGDLVARDKRKKTSRSRSHAVYLLRKFGYSYDDIGEILGGRTSPTMVQAYASVPEIMRRSLDYHFENWLQNEYQHDYIILKLTFEDGQTFVGKTTLRHQGSKRKMLRKSAFVKERCKCTVEVLADDLSLKQAENYEERLMLNEEIVE